MACPMAAELVLAVSWALGGLGAGGQAKSHGSVFPNSAFPATLSNLSTVNNQNGLHMIKSSCMNK